ncbi:MAG: inorganic phosphate transporter [Halobacteria archaeon]
MQDIALLTAAGVAGLFMAWNIGANDLANALGTSVGSGMVSAKKAVLLGTFLMFFGAVFVGRRVTETIQKGIIDPSFFQASPMLLTLGMLSALLAASTWVAIATYYGLPVSTTHSIVGAVVGFGIISVGIQNIKMMIVLSIATSWITSPIFAAILSYIVLKSLDKSIFSARKPIKRAEKIGPLWVGIVFAIIGFSAVYKGIKNLEMLTMESALVLSVIIGGFAYIASSILFKTAERKVRFESRQVELLFGYLAILTGGYVAFGIGANDIANAIGPFAAILNIMMTGDVSMRVGIEWWMLAFGGVGMALGCLTWGYKVIATISEKITEITPDNAFAAQFSAATVVILASKLGMPISTTHAIVGAVVGVGLARGIKALNIKVVRDIVTSWIATIPTTMIFAILIYSIIAIAVT